MNLLCNVANKKYRYKRLNSNKKIDYYVSHFGEMRLTDQVLNYRTTIEFISSIK